ncbi:choice-of-anchor A family protein [Luteolibacter sp. SL250]|uniref:choice-of-anchor A family protein n=1 Tax=Luteolibacter sp. SL250 TaxID=2995170 RepID=UPI00226EFB44|nr:choice-of-anchor A family protein [Luteolibacter sp. SL250]WAC19484.1 choice-of-anchor A family protein [Luteolibacter sp. SL250]
MYLASSKVAARTLAAVSTACAVFTAFTPSASAQSLGAASDYNVFIFGNFTSSGSDTEGRLAVGGNADLTNYSVGSSLPTSGGNTLVVGNNLTFTSGQVNKGDAVYGNTASTSNFGIPDGSLVKGSPIDFSAAQSQLTQLSGSLAGMAANGSFNDYYGTLQFVGSDPSLNTFTVTAPSVNSANGIQINAPANSTVVINIGGDNIFFDNFGISIANTDKQRVLYNFYEATALTIAGISVQGSVLAPLANVTFSNGNVEGTLIANNVTGQGEYHNYKFQGTLPVPEPSGAALLGLSLASLAFRRRR